MKVTFLFLLLSGFILTGVRDDEAQILQKCVDLPQLQAYYPRDVNGVTKQLNVLQHGVSFPENINVSANGKNLSFLSKKQIGQTDAYFLFHEFRISETSATVAFVYQYSETPLVVVNLELSKMGDTWSITKSQIEKR